MNKPFDENKLINDLYLNDKKKYKRRKPISYFCRKYGIDIWLCLNYYNKVMQMQRKTGDMIADDGH